MLAKWGIVVAAVVIALGYKYMPTNLRGEQWSGKWMPSIPLAKEKLQAEYDYVIVGAGSAGSVLAVRLTEDPNIRVALLEAGPNNEEFPELVTPLCYSGLQKSDIDWRYQTVPQEHACRSIQDQKATLPRGRMLGGTSGMNGVMAIRGSRHDYDRWAAMGNDGWSYDEVLPYFKKLETVHEKKYTENGQRGENGPVQVTDTHAYPEATSAFIKAAEMQGFEVGDVNAEEMHNKVMKVQANVGLDGARQSTAEAYLKPINGRKNLDVLPGAHVTKVLFRGKRAIGLQYMSDGRSRSVKARKEVILSAGTFGSSQILMLSGVGPKEHLEEMGIKVVADLPVGQNLRDHVHIHAAMVTLEKPAALVTERLGFMDKLEYDIFGTGAYSHAGPIVTAFAKSQLQPKDVESPYLQYVLLNNMMNAEGHRNNINLKPDVHDALYGGFEGRDGLVLLLALQQLGSVGYVKLASTNPFDMPLINPNYLADDMDVEILLEGVRTARKVMSSGPMVKELGAKLVTRVHPDCANETYDSDDYWRCYIRSNTLSFCHPVSTNRMGPTSDKNSVVDPRLRVHGLEGLRVVDASVIPMIPSGNTNFPVMMIAERTADILKGKI